ncbi:MAG: flagellar export chaperone FlgN [Spongiibacteraceae bacterium]
MTIDNLISEIHLQAQQLAKVLQRELDALRLADSADLLAELSAEKTELVRNIESLEKRKLQLTSDSAKDTYSENVEWQKTLELLKHCQAMNEQAGANIASQQRYGERALEILFGEPQQAQLYTSQGQSSAGRDAVQLGKA